MRNHDEDLTPDEPRIDWRRILWHQADRHERRKALYEEVAGGDPEPAFAAVERLLTHWYRLNRDVDPPGPVPCECCDLGDNGVRASEIDEVLVSTVFLSLNHQWDPDAPPLVFETMVFIDEEAVGIQARYSTWDEAVAGHNEIAGIVFSPIERWKRFVSRKQLTEGDTTTPSALVLVSQASETWRDIEAGDLVRDGDRIRNPYGDDYPVRDFRDGTTVLFDDGDAWSVYAMAAAGGWEILKAGPHVEA